MSSDRIIAELGAKDDQLRALWVSQLEECCRETGASILIAWAAAVETAVENIDASGMDDPEAIKQLVAIACKSLMDEHLRRNETEPDHA